MTKKQSEVKVSLTELHSGSEWIDDKHEIGDYGTQNLTQDSLSKGLESLPELSTCTKILTKSMENSCLMNLLL